MKLKVTKFSVIDWSSISNINQLIGIDCYRLVSITIVYRFHQLITPGFNTTSYLGVWCLVDERFEIECDEMATNSCYLQHLFNRFVLYST